jgi:hypothetical protein
MKKVGLFLASVVFLGAWTAFGYHEGVRVGLSAVPKVNSIDKEVTSIVGHKLYCYDSLAGLSECVIATHQDPKDGNGVLLVAKGLLEDDDNPTPKENSPTQK